jgi:DNA polymerase-3 subunit epsilon
MLDEVNEKLVRILDRTGLYRILRRVPDLPLSPMSDDDRAAAGLATAIVLDTETTGLGPDDEVIEFAMARVAFDPVYARIDHVIDTFGALREPHKAIPPEVVRLTGITDRDVAGQTIDRAEVEEFVSGAAVVIAHNAAFDRPVVERHWDVFASLPWGCSLTQVDWRAEGFEGRRLGQLLAERRLFHEGHRALDDVLALVVLLQQPLMLGATPFSLIMESAPLVTTRIWATAAPYGRKALLRQRGYRWSDGSCGPRAWLRDVPDACAKAEVQFLRTHVYEDETATPLVRRIGSVDRFSVRAGAPAQR